MGILEAYKMALKSIIGNKIRALLTMLGVIIGVGSVIAAVAFAQGSTKQVTDSIQGLGTNLIQISITGRNSNRNISYDDLLSFADTNVEKIKAVSPTINGSVKAKFGVKSRDTSLIGTNAEYEVVKNVHVSAGRFLGVFDIESRQKVAIIGTAVVNDIFDKADPLGKTVMINGEEFKVVGVLQEKEGGQDQSADDTVIIPVTVAQRLMKSATIRNFAVEAADPKYVDEIMNSLNDLLYKVYRDNKTYRVFNQAQMLSTLNNVTGVMMGVLGGIATISLVVGGIGIMNIMLVSVTERTREIGIRKAIGAKKKNILIQFLIEALMVTGIGGFIGVMLGLAIIKFILGGFNIVPEVYSMPWILLSFGISLGVGVIFGMFPAYKAANLNPIEALRFE